MQRRNGVGSSQYRVFQWPVRVYWEDTDAGGIVYHANYLRFFERARSEWLRAAGFDQEKLRAQADLLFVVHRMQIAFSAPARLDDLLTATVEPQPPRGASFIVTQRLVREPGTRALVEAQVRIACLDALRLRPRAIPEHLLQGLVRT